MPIMPGPPQRRCRPNAIMLSKVIAHRSSEPTEQNQGQRGPWVAIVALPVVALVIPASLVVSGPLRSNGWPARLIVFWVASMVVLGWIARGRTGEHALAERARVAPIEVGAWLLLLALSTSLAATGLRELTELESAGSIRFALVMIPLTIVAIGVSTLADVRRSDQVLAAILLGATAGALVAIVQFIVPLQWDQILQLPGLEAADAGGTGTRGGFERIRGASAHPIELGVICGAALPLGVHFSRFGKSVNSRLLATCATIVLLIAIPLSVSRSGVLVAILAIAIYAATLNGRQRLTALILAVAGLAVFRAAVPGLLGTVLAIFTGASSDDSITGRTDDYALINELWRAQPLLGFGLGTFRPEEYFFLDNQYLMSLVEGGVTLLVVTILFFVLGLGSARGAVRRAGAAVDASRAQAVGAALVAIAISGTFFDLFSFAQVTIMTFLLAGVSGALWHDGVDRGVPLPTPWERFSMARNAEHDPRSSAVRRS